MEGLTRRELEILVLVVDGMTYEQVAERLILAPCTVRTHMKNIYKKLQIKSQAQLFKWFYVQMGRTG